MKNKIQILVFIYLTISIVSALECLPNQIKDEVRYRCLNSPQECKNNLSKDGKRCLEECFYEIEYVTQMTGYKQCKRCNKSIYNMIDQQGIQHCGYSCPDGFYQIQGSSHCTKYCNNGDQYLLEEFPNLCFEKKEFCKGYFYQKECLKSCPPHTFKFEKNENTYGYCSEQCNDRSYIDENNVKWCLKECPNGTIEEYEKNECILPKDCKYFVDYYSKYCRFSCGNYPYEEINGYKQCMQCDLYHYFEPGKNPIPYCGSCPQNSLLESSNNCIPLSECEYKPWEDVFNYLSLENKTCDNQRCILPEVLSDKDKQCVNYCKNNPNCESRCPKGFYEFDKATVNGVDCIQKCDYFISSNNKKCVRKCSQILEINPSEEEEIQQCIKCPKEYFPYFNEQGFIECKLLSIQESQQLILKTLNNYRMVTLRNQLESYLFILKEYFNKKLSLNQDSFTTILDIASDASYYINRFTAFFQNEIIQYESKEKNYEIIFQKMEFALTYECRIIDKFVVEQLKTYKRFFDIAMRLKESDVEESILIMTITNPFCKINECLGSKLFILKKGNPKFDDRKPNLSRVFEVVFKVNPSITLKEKIICLSYDNNGNSSPLKTILSPDKSKVTCYVQATQLNAAYIFDEKCQFVNKSLCSGKQQSLPNTDPISKGENKLRGGGK